MPDLWTGLLECLDLAPTSSDGTAGATGVATFEGRNQHLEYHRVFGGQLLGQLIEVARLVCPEKAVKSLHTVFAREGRAEEPVIFEAMRHHEGRSFATLTITGRQAPPPRVRRGSNSGCAHRMSTRQCRRRSPHTPPTSR